MQGSKWILKILAITFVLITICEARGGGGRRGGSMGGLFGSWRKYKKPSSSSSSTRRIVSSSPVHTPITKALNEKKTTGSDKFVKNGKTYNKYSAPPVPPGGSYYTNTAAMPGNAIYVAQAPPRGAEFGDFLTGYLTGRLMTMGFAPYHSHHVTHIYRDNPEQSGQVPNNNNSGKVIVINNNQETMTTTIKPADFSSTTTEMQRSEPYTLAYMSSTPTPMSSTTETPPYGIICMPLKVKETNASGNAVEVERIVCYPAPPPNTPVQNEMKSKPVEIAGDIVDH
ncbi:uncharacterized protein LOC106084808 [Stomoxys calcitrans]|uniref:DUF4794 domain-containing protein n=1 Tax=Stomoxys calcitrans TaxID=35570 RepID=A0A1I8NXY9_STOCA|nr:uncharacterized protein LOC106084808 [Stomoxys calcitrans]